MTATQATRITLGGYSTPLDPASVRAGTAPITASAQPSDAVATATAEPTMVCAQEQAPPVTPQMRWRVWRELNDRAAPYGPFHIQAATLAEAVQLERILEACDDHHDRSGISDIEHWDGTTWAPIATSADEAMALLQRIWDLDDATPATGPYSQGRPPSAASKGLM